MLGNLLFGGARSRGESRASVENPAVPLSDPRVWDEILSGQDSAAGEPMTALKAQMLAPVWQAISMISGGVARMPLAPYNITGETRELDRKHSSYRTVRRRANRERSAFIFWRTFVAQAALENEAIAFINRSPDGTTEMINIRRDAWRVERKGGQLRYFIHVGSNNGFKEEPFDPSEVFHVSGPTLDPLHVPRLVSIARDSWGVAFAAQKYEGSFFKNGNRVGGFLLIPSHFTQESADNLETGFRKATSGANNWFKTVVMRDGAKFEKNQFSFSEMEMTEIRAEAVRDVARWFNLAPSRLGLNDSHGYNSKFEDNRDFLDTTLSPWLTAIAAECWMKLLTEEEQRSESHEFMFDTSILLTLNPRDQVQVDAMQVRNNLRLIDELRKRDGFAPLPNGAGAQPLQMPGAPKQPAAGSSDGGGDKQPADPGAANGDATGSSSGGARSDTLDEVKRLADAFGILVRSGVLTPQQADEEFLRQAAGLPGMSEEVLAAWLEEPVRRPITLAGASAAPTPAPGDQPPPADNPPPTPDGNQSGRDAARDRIRFGLTAHARKKSSRGSRAFLEWIDGGLASHIAEARELCVDPEIVIGFREELLGLAENVTEAELQAAVDLLCTEFEG